MAGESERLFVMFMGWALAWYGVHRRHMAGAVTALSGLSLVMGALILPESVCSEAHAQEASKEARKNHFG